jgi:hypothetical protein
MRNEAAQDDPVRDAVRAVIRVPRPSPQFRRRSWLLFQRALDPLAPPRPLRERKT